MRVLGLADQPWQAELVLDILDEMKKENNENFHGELLLTDYYTFFNAPELISFWEKKYDVQILHQEKLFNSWQMRCNHNARENDVFLAKWEENWCKDRKIHDLEKTNPWIFGYEREFFFLKTPLCCRQQILVDSIKWVDSIMDGKKFDFIFSIERYTLPTNLIQTVAKEKEIPFLTVIPTRIKTRWFVSKYFGYGTDPEFYKEVITSIPSKKSICETEDYIEGISKKNQPSYGIWQKGKFIYLNTSYSAINNNLTQIQIFEDRIEMFINFMKQSFARYVHRKKLPYKPRILEQDYFRLDLFEFRALLIKLVRSLGFNFSGTTSPNYSEKYYLWFLHTRPEGSGLVLSNAVDEVKELRKFASVLPDGFFLYVKENPLMFGYRNFRFYRELSKIDKVILIDPFVSNSKLFPNAIGTVGLSGTALLESMAYQKPTLVLGNPEFREFISHKGWVDVPRFFESREVPSNLFDIFKKYISYLIEHSNVNDVAEFSPNASVEMKQMAKSFATRLIMCFENYNN